MRILVWVLRIVLFLVFVMFAVINTAPTTLNLLVLHWTAPVALVALAFFLVGVVVGAMLTLPYVFRRRAESRRPESIAPATVAPATSPEPPRLG
ncbi:LapA family protein [Derxia gummosa]|uniref:LapA family protein n=1 Tax=Derxia gummosa DSM 723 TaxID=1121388 RepID=A0A8B6X963_9BURK|nr:LapA family protein [Derxia gummosa]